MTALSLVEEARGLEQRLVEWRRELHRSPEPGFCEFRTAARVARELESLGFDVRLGADAMDPEAVLAPAGDRADEWLQEARSAGVPDDVLAVMEGGLTAVVGDLRLGSGPTVAFRFDMDCLPVTEADDAQHAPLGRGFASERRGFMHACGHDGHVAMGLGLATAVSAARESLNGTVRLIFQPAEEGCPGGARAIVARGVLDDVDYLVCTHLGLEAKETGAVVCATDFMATSKYRVTFTGRGAHVVNAPETGRNALLAAATAVLNLHAISAHAAGWFNFNVGVLRAGVEQGVTPPSATMDLGFWAENTTVQEYVRERMFSVLEGAAAVAGVEVVVDHIGEAPSCPGDTDLLRLARTAAESLPEIHEVTDFVVCRAGEDATLMLQRVAERGGRGTYVLVGTPIGDGHHTPRFDIDERALMIGTAWLAAIVENVLGDSPGAAPRAREVS